MLGHELPGALKRTKGVRNGSTLPGIEDKKRTKTKKGERMNTVSIQNDMSVFIGRLAYIRPAQQLLAVLSYLRDQTNELKTSVKELVEAISEDNRTVSARTVRGWLNLLAKNGAIKYKYSGKIMINPNYVFEGTEDEFISALQAWESFKSDVAEVEIKKAI